MFPLNRILLDKEPADGSTITADGVPSGGETLHVDEVAAEIPASDDTVIASADEDNTESVDFNSFLGKKEEPLMSAEKPKKEEPKVEVTPVVPADKKKETTTIPTVDGKKVITTRDYAGLPENVVPLFKRMSNDAFDALKPFYLEAEANKVKLAELEKAPKTQPSGLPEHYYEHPSAYVLSPEYSQAAQLSQEATGVLEHWREQLDNVRNGGTTYVPLQRDPSSKQIVMGAPVKVDTRTQSYLEQLYFNSNAQAQQFGGKLQSVQQQFQGRHQQAIADLQAYEEQTFTGLDDNKHPLKPAVMDTLSKMNPTFRSSPMAKLVAKAIVVSNVLANKLLEAQIAAKGTATPTVKSKVAAAQSKAGPTATGAASTAAPKEEEVSFDDFQKVKEL